MKVYSINYGRIYFEIDIDVFFRFASCFLIDSKQRHQRRHEVSVMKDKAWFIYEIQGL